MASVQVRGGANKGPANPLRRLPECHPPSPSTVAAAYSLPGLEMEEGDRVEEEMWREGKQWA